MVHLKVEIFSFLNQIILENFPTLMHKHINIVDTKNKIILVYNIIKDINIHILDTLLSIMLNNKIFGCKIGYITLNLNVIEMDTYYKTISVKMAYKIINYESYFEKLPTELVIKILSNLKIKKDIVNFNNMLQYKTLDFYQLLKIYPKHYDIICLTYFDSLPIEMLVIIICKLNKGIDILNLFNVINPINKSIYFQDMLKKRSTKHYILNCVDTDTKASDNLLGHGLLYYLNDNIIF